MSDDKVTRFPTKLRAVGQTQAYPAPNPDVVRFAEWLREGALSGRIQALAFACVEYGPKGNLDFAEGFAMGGPETHSKLLAGALIVEREVLEFVRGDTHTVEREVHTAGPTPDDGVSDGDSA